MKTNKIAKNVTSLPEGWKQITRETGLIEWVCPHNVGHPAPREYQTTKSYNGIHGCDGCCREFYKKKGS